MLCVARWCGCADRLLTKINRTLHRQIHSPYPFEVSLIDRGLWCQQHKRYWVQRALDHLQQRGIR
jgi:hypothetical protein